MLSEALRGLVDFMDEVGFVGCEFMVLDDVKGPVGGGVVKEGHLMEGGQGNGNGTASS